MSDQALSFDDWKQVARATLSESKDDDVASLASGVAFKIFLSLVPSIIAGVAIFSLITSPEQIDRILERLGQIAPPEVVQLIRDPLEGLVTGGQGAARGVAVVGVLGGIWAASSAAVTLMRALSRAFDGHESRGFVAQRLVALAIIVALFVALTAILALLVFGGQLEEVALDRLALGGPARAAIDFALTAARLAGSVLILMVLFAFVYWVGPDREHRPPWMWISPGAVLGVILWLVLSGGFSLYTQTIGTYEEGQVYGALGGVIVTMLWLQLSMVALLLGAELNAELYAFRRRRAAAAARVEIVPELTGPPTASRPHSRPIGASALAAVAAGAALLPSMLRAIRRLASRGGQ